MLMVTAIFAVYYGVGNGRNRSPFYSGFIARVGSSRRGEAPSPLENIEILYESYYPTRTYPTKLHAAMRHSLRCVQFS